MIVFHSFFYKAHPRYLDHAVGMMRGMNGRAFLNHDHLNTFVTQLRNALMKDGGDRYQKREIGVVKVNGQIQIEVKGGLDYAARISYIYVEYSMAYGVFSENLHKSWCFRPDGNMEYFEDKSIK